MQPEHGVDRVSIKRRTKVENMGTLSEHSMNVTICIICGCLADEMHKKWRTILLLEFHCLFNPSIQYVKVCIRYSHVQQVFQMDGGCWSLTNAMATWPEGCRLEGWFEETQRASN